MDRDYWNGEAGQAWADSHDFMETVLAPFGRALIEAAELPSRGVVVDVGCGCGATTLLVAERQPQLRVVGVDVSRPMLAVARSRAPDYGQVRFDNADAAEASPSTEPVDRVISRFGIMFFSDPPAAFANIRGWMAPQGRFAGLVWDPLSDNPWLFDLMQLVSKYTELPPMDPTAPGPFSLGDTSRVDALLQGAGFCGVAQRSLDLPMRIPGTVDDAIEFCLYRGPVATAIADLEESKRAGLVEDIRTLVTARHDGNGTPLSASARLVTATA